MSERDLKKPTSDELDSAGDQITTPVIDEKGKVTTRAVKDGVQALAICRRLRQDNDVRNWKNAMILAAYGGEAPFDQEALNKAAQDWRNNVSSGHMEGVINRSLPDHTEIGGDIDRLGNLEGDLAEHKRRIIREEFIRQIKQWGMWLNTWELTMLFKGLFGWSVHVWFDRWNPWPSVYYNAAAHVPERTPSHPALLKVFCVYQAMEVDELYAKIEKAPSGAEEYHGWKVKNVQGALMASSDTRREENQWVEYENDIRAGTVHTAICGSKVVEVYHLIVVELDGTLTQFIVSAGDGHPPRTDVTGTDRDKPTLFKKENIKEKMPEFVTRYAIEPGDGTWHGPRGIGHRSMNAHRVKDRLYCNILDNTQLAGMILAKSGGEDQEMLMQLQVSMPIIFVPAELQLQEATVPAVTDSAFKALAMVSGNSEERVGDTAPNQSESRQVDVTATESSISNANKNKVTKNQLTRDVDPLASTLTNIFKRLARKNSQNTYAVDFKKRLTEKKITQEDLDKIDGVKSFSNASDVFGDIKASIAAVKQVFAGVGEVNWIEVNKDLMTCMVGAEKAMRYLPLPVDTTQKIEATRQQKLELTTIEDNVPVEVSPRDLHEFHAPIVDQWFQDRIGQAAQGGAHQELTPNTLAIGLAHLDAHLQFIEADKTKKDFVAPLRENYKKYEAIVKKLVEADAAAMAQSEDGTMGGTIPGAPAGGAPLQPEPVRAAA